MASASRPSEAQETALRAALRHRLHAPATGAYRRLSGEVDNVSCFNSRTLNTLVKKGWMEQAGGLYSITVAGKSALTELEKWRTSQPHIERKEAHGVA